MKYLIMMFGCAGMEAQSRPPEWIAGMGELMTTLEGEMREAGELVASVGLVDPGRATTVRFTNGVPAATDGPFAEVKESLAGYWLIEASHERALEIASRVVGYVGHPMEIRQVMHEGAPPDA
jgi:hypothetical protein